MGGPQLDARSPPTSAVRDCSCVGGSLSASPQFRVGRDPGPMHRGTGGLSRARVSAGPGSQPRLLGRPGATRAGPPPPPPASHPPPQKHRLPFGTAPLCCPLVATVTHGGPIENPGNPQGWGTHKYQHPQIPAPTGPSAPLLGALVEDITCIISLRLPSFP